MHKAKLKQAQVTNVVFLPFFLSATILPVTGSVAPQCAFPSEIQIQILK